MKQTMPYLPTKSAIVMSKLRNDTTPQIYFVYKIYLRYDKQNSICSCLFSFEICEAELSSICMRYSVEEGSLPARANDMTGKVILIEMKNEALSIPLGVFPMDS